MPTLCRTCGVLANIAVGLSVACVVACNKTTPTEPSRYGYPTLRIECSTAGTTPLMCSARILCGFAACAPGTPDDVTGQAIWETGDPAVVSVIGPGALVAVGVGDTLVRATWQSLVAQHPISVFTASPPLPTQEIFGSVYEAGKTAAVGPISGSTIQVISGLLSGRSATSGVPPPLLPGFFGPFGGPDYYRILGVPPGTYRLRVSMDGFVTQERDVTLTSGSVNADFQLSPL